MLAKLKDFDLQSENQGNLQEGGYVVGGEMNRGTKCFTGIDYVYFFGRMMDTWVLTL